MKNSAKGDKIDIAGKLPQFEFFVDKTYQLLISENLEWIKIGDSKAGIADDIQYSTKSEVHAYQMKWSVQTPPPTFSYKNFRDLLKDLIESWKSIKSNNPTKSVRIKVITSQPPSKDDTVIIYQGKKNGSFNDFLNEYYTKIKGGSGEISKIWRDFIQDEIKLLDIVEDDFNAFLQDFEFIFNAKRPSYSENRHSPKIEEHYNKFTKFLLEEYYNPKSKVQFSADEIKKVLGLQTSTIFFHDFFVDLEIYKPNTITIDALNSSVNKLTGGYILLSGKPGTGKSTLLTEWTKTRKERIIRYYAYSNLSPSSPTRGEANNLFFDLVVQIKDNGFYDEKVYPYHANIEQTRSAFFRQLQLLQEDFINTGQKTIIIIDGLDHIPREYNPKDSLIKHLPEPNDIPDGVLFILGSQTFEFSDLNSSIKTLNKSAERSIAVSPLTKQTVGEIISKFSSNNEEIIEKVFYISEGHPLYLGYILKKIQGSDNQLEQLSELEPLGGNIEDYYLKIWANHHSNSNLVSLLGLIVRLRFGFDERLINEWKIARDEQLLMRTFFKQFFDKSFDTWTIFHNSFRQFLLRKTAEGIFSEDFDENTNINFHVELAEKSKLSRIPVFQFERLYHLFESRQNNLFLEEATPEYFNAQIDTFRPFSFIKEDLKMGLSIASEKQNVSVLLKFAFLSSEFSRREWNFGQDKLFEFFPEILDSDTVQLYAFISGFEIRTQEVKLKLSRAYIKSGKVAEAKLLFRIAQPVEIKDNGIVLSANHRRSWENNIEDLIKEWVYTAHYFLPIPTIIDIIINLRTEGKKNNEKTRKNEDGRKRAKLIFSLLNYLIQESEELKIWSLIECFDIKQRGNKDFNFVLLEKLISYFIELNNIDSSSKILTIILANYNKSELNNAQRIQVSYMIFKIQKNKKLIVEWMSGIEMPAIESLSFSQDTDILDEISLFRYLQLKHYLEESISVNTLFPLESDNEKNVLIEYKRLFFFMYQILQDADNGLTLNTKNLLPIIRYFYQEHGHRHRHWYYISRKRHLVISFLIDIISKYGKTSLDDFWQFLENEFIQFPQYWVSNNLKVNIAIELFEKGHKKDKVRQLLIDFEQDIVSEGWSLDDRINQSLSICKYWLKINEIETAKNWLTKAQQESLGVGNRKDYQLQTWMKWLEKINKIEVDKVYERINWLSSVNEHIYQTTENAGSDISEPLLRSLLEHNLFDGLVLLKWQLEQVGNGLIGYTDSLYLFLEYFILKSSKQNLNLLLDIWGKLFIFTHKYSYVDLLEKLVNQAAKLLDNKEYQKFISKVLYFISVYTISEHRIKYYTLLKDMNISIGFDFETKPQEKEAIEQNILHLSNNLQLSENEVIASIHTFEDFWYFFTNQDFPYTNEFNWETTLKNVKKLIDENHVRRAIDFLISTGKDTFSHLYTLAEFCIENKFYDCAREVCVKFLSDDNTTWIPSSDGLRRLKAHNLLVKIGGIKERKNAFNDFANKIENYLFLELLPLEDIFDTIAPDYQVSEIWIEIEEYLKRLLATAQRTKDLPVFEKQDKDLDYVIADLLLYYINQPALTISQPSLEIFINHLSEGKKGFIDKLKEYCAENTMKNQINTSHILSCVSTLNDEVIKEFYDEVQLLEKSRLFSVNAIARDLLFQVWDIRELGLDRLFFDYKWEMYKRDLLLLNSSESYSDSLFSNETLEKNRILNSLKRFIKFLSNLSKLPEEIWESKIISVIIKLEENNELNEFIEEKKDVFNVDFNNINVDNVVANLSKDLLLKEVFDLGLYSYEEVFRFITKSFDEDCLKIVPEAKPKFIEGIIKEGITPNVSNSMYHLKSDWYLNVSQIIDNYQWQFNDYVIIAESTTIRGLGWALEAEERNAFISKKLYNSNNIKEGVYQFEVVHSVLLKEYPSNILECKDLIIFNGNEFKHQCPEKIINWLAFNPIIAIQMGWIYDEGAKDAFRWINEKGIVMVESIYWADGNSCLQPPHLYSESGAGWFVRASLIAFEQLKTIFNLSHVLVFTRTQQVDSIRYDKTAKKVCNNLK